MVEPGVRRRRREISVSVSGSSSRQHLEDRLERAVAARAMEAELVAEAAVGGELPAGESSAASALTGSSRRAAHAVGGFGEHAGVGGPSVGERLDQPRELVARAVVLVFVGPMRRDGRRCRRAASPGPRRPAAPRG